MSGGACRDQAGLAAGGAGRAPPCAGRGAVCSRPRRRRARHASVGDRARGPASRWTRGMTFARPWLLLLLLAIPWWWWRRCRGTTAAPYSDVGIPARAARPAWWIRLPVILRSVSLASWIVAAAGPRLGGERLELKKEGIAIVIAIDVSS